MVWRSHNLQTSPLTSHTAGWIRSRCHLPEVHSIDFVFRAFHQKLPLRGISKRIPVVALSRKRLDPTRSFLTKDKRPARSALPSKRNACRRNATLVPADGYLRDFRGLGYSVYPGVAGLKSGLRSLDLLYGTDMSVSLCPGLSRTPAGFTRNVCGS